MARSATKTTTPAPEPEPSREEEETRTALQTTGGATMPQEFAEDAERYAGAGTSDRREDNIVPFLSLLQKGSPEVNEKMPAYIKGAKPGMLMNTASFKLYDAERDPEGNRLGPRAIQAHSETCEIEWIPRGQGGGFVARHPIDTTLLREVREIPNPQNPNSKRMLRMLPNGHQLVTTAYHYLILIPELEPVVVALSSTGLQTHRQWNTMLRNKRIRTAAGLKSLPSFATMLRLHTFWQQNDQGDWFSLSVEDLGFVPIPEWKDAYEMAKAFHVAAIADGVRTGAPPDQGGGERTIDGEDSSEDDSPL